VSVRTTIDIPDDLYGMLRQRAATERTSIRALVIDAVDSKYRAVKKGKRLTGPPIRGKGKPGPLCPDRENPYGLVFD
jgi:hypothetical protein